jgi:tetratricopeptide (TPR) repeat protein
LTSAHLLAEHRPGRFTLHDLLRSWATELALESDHDERDAALRRVLDHYVYSAHEAALLIEPLRQPIPLSQPAAGVTLRCPADREHALEWFGTEYAGLSSAIEQSHAAGLYTHTWQLVWTLADFQQWRGLWQDRAANLHTALDAVRRLDNRAEQARAHRGLGYAYTRMARDEDANTHLRDALRLYHDLGDRVGQGRAHHGLSYLLERRGDTPAALAHAQMALDLFPVDGSRAHRARALGTVGWCHGQLGDHKQSQRYNELALALLKGTGDRVAEAATWDSLGFTHHHLGQHQQAIECYETALRLRRDLGHRYGEANTLSHLGETYLAVGKPEYARAVWNEALAIFVQLGEPDADRIRRRLPLADSSRTDPLQALAS